MGSEDDDRKRAGGRAMGAPASGGGIALGIAAVVVVGAAGKLFSKLRRRLPDTLAAADPKLLPLLDDDDLPPSDPVINGERASSLERRKHDGRRIEESTSEQKNDPESSSDGQGSMTPRDSDETIPGEMKDKSDDTSLEKRAVERFKSVSFGQNVEAYERDYLQEPFRRTKSRALRDDIANVISSAFEEFQGDDFSDGESAPSELIVQLTVESAAKDEEDADEGKRDLQLSHVDVSAGDSDVLSASAGSEALKQPNLSSTEADGLAIGRVDKNVTVDTSASSPETDSVVLGDFADLDTEIPEEANSDSQLPPCDLDNSPSSQGVSDLDPNSQGAADPDFNPHGYSYSDTNEQRQQKAELSAHSKAIDSAPPTTTTALRDITSISKSSEESNTQDRVHVMATLEDGLSVKATITLPDSTQAKADPVREIRESIEVATQIARGLAASTGPAGSVSVTSVTTTEGPSGDSRASRRSAITSTVQVVSTNGGGLQQRSKALNMPSLKIVLGSAIVVIAFIIFLLLEESGVKSLREILKENNAANFLTGKV